MRRRAPSKIVRTQDGRMARLRPVRLYRLKRRQAQINVTIQPTPQQEPAEQNQPNLQPIQNGQYYRVVSPAEEALGARLE